MKISTLATFARLFLGAVFVFAGLNGLAYYAGYEPVGPSSVHVPEMQWLLQNKWLFMPEKILELMGGLLLLLNLRVPVALVALAPISLSIFFFHLLFDQALLLNGILVVALVAFLLYAHREAVRRLFGTNKPFVARA